MTTPTSPIHGTIQIAHKNAVEWTAQNPTLLAGQLAIETDTRKMKAGNGTAAWNSLGYITGTGGGGGASAYTDLTDAVTATLPTTNAPLSSALGLKAPGGALISFGGTARALAATDNGNVIRCTNASAVSLTIPSGLPDGFTCVIVQGGAGLVTAVAGSGVTVAPSPELVTNGIESDLVISPAGTNAYTCYSPGEIATLQSQIDDLFAAISGLGSVIAQISGVRGTGLTLSAAVGTGWQGTLQWQSKIAGVWTNIAAATASTYVQLIGDAPYDIRCLFTPTSFFTNTIVAPGGGGGTPFTPFTELWVSAGHGNPPAAPWSIIAGSPTEYIISGEGRFLSGASAGRTVRNASGTDGTIEFSLSDNPITSLNAVELSATAYSVAILRSNAAATNYCFVQVDPFAHRMVYGEWDGAAVTNSANGTTVIPTSGYMGLKLTAVGTSLTVEVDIGSGYVTDISVTMTQFLTNTYVGLGNASANAVAMGPMRVT